jgi:hypothetical protein
VAFEGKNKGRGKNKQNTKTEIKKEQRTLFTLEAKLCCVMWKCPLSALNKEGRTHRTPVLQLSSNLLESDLLLFWSSCQYRFSTLLVRLDLVMGTDLS